MPKKPNASESAAAPPALPLPPLAEAAARLEAARGRLEEQIADFERRTLAGRLKMGAGLLIAWEHHGLPNGGDRRSKKFSVTRDTDPNSPHSQGFAGWVAAHLPWLARPTAYKYLDAARGAGLTAHSTEAEIDQLVAEKLAGFSLAALVAAGRKLLPPPPPEEEDEDDGQMTFESIKGWRASSEQILALRESMTPRQIEIAVASAYELLTKLTKTPWQPADQGVAKYEALIEELRQAGGL